MSCACWTVRIGNVEGGAEKMPWMGQAFSNSSLERSEQASAGQNSPQSPKVVQPANQTFSRSHLLFFSLLEIDRLLLISYCHGSPGSSSLGNINNRSADSHMFLRRLHWQESCPRLQAEACLVCRPKQRLRVECLVLS